MSHQIDLAAVPDTAPQGISCALLAELFSSSGKLTVEITRLSTIGAIALSENLPPEGSLALLVRNGIKLFGVVNWEDKNSIGLHFEEPLINPRRWDAFRHGWGSDVSKDLLAA